MGPPLGSQPCPLGLVQPLQPARPGEVGHLSHPITTPPLIEHCRARLNGDNLRTAPNTSQLNVIAILLLGIVRHVPALPAPVPVWTDAKPAPETLCSPSASVTRVAFVGPARHRRGRRFLPRQGLGVFRHAWVSEKRSQTLNSLGENHYG